MRGKTSVSKIVLENISHSYGNLPVLNQLNLTVQANEIVVMVGPSGCGKSTILNLLSGYLKPVSGAIQRIGVTRTVYQQDGLFPWLTVIENIAVGVRTIEHKDARENEVRELIELVHMAGFENHYPHELSGGMRQRVELARVLAGDSDILLMDEPFSSLDYQSRLRMRRELIALLKNRPRTVIFVTHDIEEAVQLADRILVLSSRPATIKRELTIDTPKPRDLTDSLSIEITKEIISELGLREY
jgi:NitT/TauT family transport system ATP-binding protein